MNTKLHAIRKNLSTTLVGTLCILGAFAFGIDTGRLDRPSGAVTVMGSILDDVVVEQGTYCISERDIRRAKAYMQGSLDKFPAELDFDENGLITQEDIDEAIAHADACSPY